MIDMIKPKASIIGAGLARSTMKLMALFLTFLVSSCGAFVGENGEMEGVSLVSSVMSVIKDFEFGEWIFFHYIIRKYILL